jgi:carbonic anhydrase
VVFDQGLGDVFVVRSAGNVVDDAALGSIEFAVAKLGARLILVLGHERCGAVEAALADAAVPGHVKAIVDAIRPHLAHTADRPGDRLENAVTDNVAATVAALQTAEPVLAPMVRDGSLRVVGAIYDLDTGQVRVLDAAGRP